MIQPGLIDDQTVISAELDLLVKTLGKLDEVIASDRAALTVVKSAEHVLDIAGDGKRLVVFSSPRTGVVVDREWVAGS